LIKLSLFKCEGNSNLRNMTAFFSVTNDLFFSFQIKNYKNTKNLPNLKKFMTKWVFV